jgi:hypothetical protein
MKENEKREGGEVRPQKGLQSKGDCNWIVKVMQSKQTTHKLRSVIFYYTIRFLSF